MVAIGSGTEREINDLILTRFACYLKFTNAKFTLSATDLATISVANI